MGAVDQAMPVAPARNRAAPAGEGSQALSERLIWLPGPGGAHPPVDPLQHGRELSFVHAGPGSIFGEIAALDGGERTAEATAITRVQATALPQRALLEAIENNPKVAMAAIHFLCMRVRETDQRLEAIALHRIELRLARMLLSALRLQSP
jgi:CRP-like cAMP-binding protein